MLVSVVQQSESVICICRSPYPLPLEPPSQNHWVLTAKPNSWVPSCLRQVRKIWSTFLYLSFSCLEDAASKAWGPTESHCDCPVIAVTYKRVAPSLQKKISKYPAGLVSGPYQWLEAVSGIKINLPVAWRRSLSMGKHSNFTFPSTLWTELSGFLNLSQLLADSLLILQKVNRVGPNIFILCEISFLIVFLT